MNKDMPDYSPLPADLSRGSISRRSLLGAFAAGFGAGLAGAALAPSRAWAADSASGGLVLAPTPQPVSELLFSDAGNFPKALSEYKGRVVLFNAWATWCPPCVAEMPSLSALQAQFDVAQMMVLPVSMDRGGVERVQKFYADHQISNLPVLLDRELSIPRRLQPRGLPLSLLINKDGQEVGRAVGGIDWADAKIANTIRAFL